MSRGESAAKIPNLSLGTGCACEIAAFESVSEALPVRILEGNPFMMASPSPAAPFIRENGTIVGGVSVPQQIKRRTEVEPWRFRMRRTKTSVEKFSRLTAYSRRMAFFSLLSLSAGCLASQAQSSNPAGRGAVSQDNAGFYPGWTLRASFEGSTSGDGSVYEISTAAGYNFSHHFGVDLSVPYFFVGAPSAVKTNNPQAVPGNGIGSIGANLKWLFPGKTMNYASTIHLGAPTGDTKKGFSNGHATWNWTNHLEHSWGIFTPFIDGGIGNTVGDAHHVKKPFMTFGYNVAFEAGTQVDAGPLSFSASVYDVAPWGPQTVISRVFRCAPGPGCSAAGKTRNRKSYLLSNVSSGDASLTRDNGFNVGVEFKPMKTVNLEAAYSRSVSLQLNTFSFGVFLDIAGILRSHSSELSPSSR